MVSAHPTDLEALALRLAANGPVKTLPTPRRIRLLYKGAYIADTLGTSGAVFVWEHAYYPHFYLPKKAFCEPDRFDTLYSESGNIKNEHGRVIATTTDLRLRRRDDPSDSFDTITDSIVEFAHDLDGPAKDLRGLVKVKFDAVDQWLEEDTPIYNHPKDPFKRVDIVTSTRPIKVEIDGNQVACSAASMHLYETALPVRYYMPLTAIDTSMLRPSNTRTQCPYKGEAEYYNVVVKGNEYKDLVWFYTRPIIGCAAIAGMYCFYNEKVDISIQEHGEWVKLERPNTHFA